MKIGILTLPIAENYGGILQAIALYRFLYNEGHDVILIYKEIDSILLKRIIRKILLKIPFHDIKGIKSWQQRKEFHRLFIDKEIFKISEKLWTKQELESFSKKENLDAIIVGSDQVWRKSYINGKYYKSYFLDFISGDKTKKIAYAASYGKDYWEGSDDLQLISKLLKDFTAISTREFSGIEVCNKTFDFANTKHVLDPTILLGKSFYINEIILKYDISRILKGGLITYVLDEENYKKDIIGCVRERLNIESVTHLRGFGEPSFTFSVPEWLASFLYADFVVTDSYHGMIFSILFEKDFVVIGNTNRGMDRFVSLLDLLGLRDRLVLDHTELNKEKLRGIDYCKINEKLDKEIDFSKRFLKEALGITI